ncbi:hypothetical protein AB0L13_38820 [Saccharopolyspora shandongensis]|uniref:hypothetical protein n=1 Tax=Saccharopolyspora shandongensis TaxID=418495 RepID=UPI003441DE2C
MGDDLRSAMKAAGWSRECIADLPTLWTHAPADDGGWWLLGGELAGDPDVMVRVEHAFPCDAASRRDLTEPFAALLGHLVALAVGGTAVATDLSRQEVADLSSQLRWLRVLLRSGT